jgi:hypothetical protein
VCYCTQKVYSNFRNVVFVNVVSPPFTVSDPHDACRSYKSTVTSRTSFYVCWLLPLAPVSGIRIERQSVVSVLVGTLWFRPVSSLSSESFFRYLTKVKCCLPCDSKVFCVTVCHAAAKLQMSYSLIFSRQVDYACNVRQNGVACKLLPSCSALSRYVTTLISHLAWFSSFVIPYASFGTQIRTLLGFELSPACISITVTLIPWV